MLLVAQMWTQGQAKGYVASVEGGVVSVRMVHGIIKSGFVQVATTCQDPVQSLDLACRYWSSLWDDEHSVDLQDEDVVALQHNLPELEQMDPTISAYELKNALRSLPVPKARGMDAVTNWELKNLWRPSRYASAAPKPYHSYGCMAYQPYQSQDAFNQEDACGGGHYVDQTHMHPS